jgi:DNA-binding transcriptional regulator YiaG
MTYKIYTITCTVNGRVYVGQTTKRLCQRWGDHRGLLRVGKWSRKGTCLLQEDFDSYGEDCFVFAHVDQADTLVEAKAKENRLIHSLGGAYNKQSAKYTVEDIRFIRNSGLDNRTLAKRYGVSEMAISKIRNRRTYQWVD